MDRDAARDLLEAISAAIASGLPGLLAKRTSVRLKEDGSPVTEADFAVEELVSDLISQSVPGMTLVSEERPLPKVTAGPVLLLDPIDGTENFCSGLKEWGVSAGVFVEGVHLASMIDLPERNERILTGEPVVPTGSRILAVSSTPGPAAFALMASSPQYRVTGCSVFSLFNVITGRFKAFHNPIGAHTWDFLPGALLARERGVSVEVDGVPFKDDWLPPDRMYAFRVGGGD